MATVRYTLNDGYSTLYVPSIDEIWRDNYGSLSSGTWTIKHLYLPTQTYGIDIPLGRRPEGETMRLDPASGHVFVPARNGSQRYLLRVNPAGGGSQIAEVEMADVDKFSYYEWQFSPEGDIWGKYGGTVIGTPTRMAQWNKGTGAVSRYLDMETPYYTNSSNQGNYYSTPIVFTPGGGADGGRMWVIRRDTIAGVRHAILTRYDLEPGMIWVNGHKTPEFELDLVGVMNAMVYDAANNCIWFQYNTPAYDGPFFGLSQVKKLDLATDTVTQTVTWPESVALDSSEFEIMRLGPGGMLWIVNELTPHVGTGVGRLYGLDTATNTVTQDILLAPYEEEGCFGGTIGTITATDVWHGDAGCGYLYQTPYVGAAPCVRPPGVPDPHDPVTPDPTIVANIFARRDDLWHPIIGPGPGIAEPGTRPFLAGGAIPPELLAGLSIRDRDAWLTLTPLFEDQFPDPETGPYPPYYDPCAELLPVVDLPPIGDVSPVPFAGGRFFGLGKLPPTLLGAIFNCAVSTLGTGTPGQITQCEARGGSLYTNNGAMSQYKSGSWYSRTAYENTIINTFLPMYSLLVAKQTSGGFIAHSMADDMRVQSIWPTSVATGGGTGSGLSDAEMNAIGALFATHMPLLRIGIRGRPLIFSSPVTNVSVYAAQYDGPRQVGKNSSATLTDSAHRVTATDLRNWRNAECARVASWGGGRQIILSLNYCHGGDGRSGKVWTDGTIFSGRYTLSAEEIELAADGFFGDGGGGYAPIIIGSLGYQYQPDLFSPQYDGAARMNAMTYFRNALMALAPL